MSAPTKDLCIIRLNESSHLPGVKKLVLNAFREGIYCFKFSLIYQRRIFEDRVALPDDADEECALEMATYQFARFMNTVGQLAAKKL